MRSAIETIVDARGITRLCHFTPSRNLSHILDHRTGILPTRLLQSETRKIYNPTDLKRLDDHPHHVSCSIEYPNAWYLDRTRSAELLFPDWVVIFIKPALISRVGTLFSPRNAAAQGGALLAAGAAKLETLFAPRVSGAYAKIRSRGPTHLPCCPTDDQAEVMVPDRIELGDILGVAVKSAEQALAESMRVEICGLDPPEFPFVIAPVLFNKYALSEAIRSGRRPTETVWRR
jgi:hypothetical protein